MEGRKHRLLLVAAHPTQYSAPVLRRMASHPQLDILVAYCSLRGARAELDPEFGVEVVWDVPLLEGYPWREVPNRALRPRSGAFFGLVNPGLWSLVRDGGFDAVVCWTGYVCASFWIVLAASKSAGIPVLFGTDATSLRARDGSAWKKSLKRRLWPRLFRMADVVIVPSSGGVRLMRDLGIPAERIVLTPYTVDNDWWKQRAAAVDRRVVRAAWGVPEDNPVALFCAKLQPWKRPLDLLRAFALAGVSGAHLVFAGEGPQRSELEAEASRLGVTDRVRFLGFVNQSQLPAVYASSDLLVLPSGYEPFGVVVNEAMLCGCAVAVSDRVGAGPDLVVPGRTGFIFPAGNVEALAAVLHEALADRAQLRRLSERARERMESWRPEHNIEALIVAVEKARQARQAPPRT